MKPVRNIAASVRQRLLDRARTARRPFNELLQYYAMERFLYRLSRSRYAEQFILKGALMLRVWRSPELRPTMDIDMLGKMNNDEGTVIAQMRAILEADVEADGLIFDATLFKPIGSSKMRIMRASEYGSWVHWIQPGSACSLT